MFREEANVRSVFHHILPQRKIFSKAIRAVYSTLLSDPAVLALVFLKVFLHLTRAGTRLSLTSFRTDTEFLRYKLKCIRLIGWKLEAGDAVSDASFLAIVDLVTCFACSGDSDEALTHLRGLRQMLKLRGGLQSLTPFLAYRIMLADTSVAAMTGDSPVLVVPSCIESLRDRNVVASISSCSSTNITATFSMLRYAFALEDYSDRLSANVLLLERDLLVESRIYRAILGGVDDEMTSRDHTAEAIRLAVIIYVELNIIPSWRFSHITRSLARRLMEALQRALLPVDYPPSFDERPLQLAWLPHHNALLLVLCLGGIGATGSKDKSWFVRQLRSLAGAMKLRDFGDVRKAIGIPELLEEDMEGLLESLWSEFSLFDVGEEAFYWSSP